MMMRKKNDGRHKRKHKQKNKSNDSTKDQPAEPEDDEEEDGNDNTDVDDEDEGPIVYQDYALALPRQSGREQVHKFRGGVTTHFPAMLHAMLSLAEVDGYAHILSWQPNGRAFCVHHREQFVRRVLPLYFRQSHYASFQRQLNLYGFHRLNSSISFSKKQPAQPQQQQSKQDAEDASTAAAGRAASSASVVATSPSPPPAPAPVYYHAMFLRTRHDLCPDIQRATERELRAKKRSLLFTVPDPDFTQFADLPPTSELDIQMARSVSMILQPAPATQSESSSIAMEGGYYPQHLMGLSSSMLVPTQHHPPSAAASFLGSACPYSLFGGSLQQQQPEAPSAQAQTGGSRRPPTPLQAHDLLMQLASRTPLGAPGSSQQQHTLSTRNQEQLQVDKNQERKRQHQPQPQEQQEPPQEDDMFDLSMLEPRPIAPSLLPLHVSGTVAAAAAASSRHSLPQHSLPQHSLPQQHQLGLSSVSHQQDPRTKNLSRNVSSARAPRQPPRHHAAAVQQPPRPTEEDDEGEVDSLDELVAQLPADSMPSLLLSSSAYPQQNQGNFSLAFDGHQQWRQRSASNNPSQRDTLLGAAAAAAFQMVERGNGTGTAYPASLGLGTLSGLTPHAPAPAMNMMTTNTSSSETAQSSTTRKRPREQQGDFSTSTPFPQHQQQPQHDQYPQHSQQLQQLQEQQQQQQQQQQSFYQMPPPPAFVNMLYPSGTDTGGGNTASFGGIGNMAAMPQQRSLPQEQQQQQQQQLAPPFPPAAWTTNPYLSFPTSWNTAPQQAQYQFATSLGVLEEQKLSTGEQQQGSDGIAGEDLPTSAAATRRTRPGSAASTPTPTPNRLLDQGPPA
ncbi:hypothetical protein ACA910_016724 [Epithemia clementina (nom. ined.)]